MPSGISIHWRMRSSCGTTKLPRAPDAELADHGRMRALQHLARSRHRRGRRARCARCAPPRGRRAWRASADFLGNVDVAAQAGDGHVGNHEAVAVAMHVQAADGEFAADAGGGVVPGAHFDDVAALDQAGELFFELLAGGALAGSSRSSCLRFARPCGSLRICSIRDSATIHYIGEAWNSRPFAWRSPKTATSSSGQSHFIKTVEDLYEAIVNTVPQMKFGIAFNEASGACLTRVDGNDAELKANATGNAQALAAGHVFVIALRDGYPDQCSGPDSRDSRSVHHLLRHREPGGSDPGRDRAGTRNSGRDRRQLAQGRRSRERPRMAARPAAQDRIQALNPAKRQFLPRDTRVFPFDSLGFWWHTTAVLECQV